MSNVMNQPVLILNAAYEAINIASAKRALKLLLKGAAVVELSTEIQVHAGYTLPSIVRLSRYRHIPHTTVMPHRENIYVRDEYTCQYCGVLFPARLLTLDHVIPRAQGGRSTWENLVACCRPCNTLKADRTPTEAGMPLLKKPRALTIHTSRHQLRLLGSTDPNWRKYLYH